MVLSKNERAFSAHFGAGIALITEPESIALVKIEKPEPLKISVASAMMIGFLKSGLSQPYLSMASS